jgi:hypothetical protein
MDASLGARSVLIGYSIRGRLIALNAIHIALVDAVVPQSRRIV